MIWSSLWAPSTTSLDPPGAEMGDLVGRDEPPHDILEEPQEHLAMDRWERRTLPRGGTSPPGGRASSAGAPASSTRAGPARGADAAYPTAGLGHGLDRMHPWRPRRTAQWASGCGPAPPAVATACPPAAYCHPPAPRRVLPAPGARRGASPPVRAAALMARGALGPTRGPGLPHGHKLFMEDGARSLAPGERLPALDWQGIEHGLGLRARRGTRLVRLTAPP